MRTRAQRRRCSMGGRPVFRSGTILPLLGIAGGERLGLLVNFAEALSAFQPRELKEVECWPHARPRASWEVLRSIRGLFVTPFDVR